MTIYLGRDPHQRMLIMTRTHLIHATVVTSTGFSRGRWSVLFRNLDGSEDAV